MRRGRKLCTAFLVAAAAVSLMAVPALAASKKKITSIRLSFEDNIVRGTGIDADDVVFDTKADNYTITEWEFENEGITWENGDVPKVTVRLETEDSYYFSVSRDDIKVTGEDTAVVDTTKKEDSQTLLITFKLPAISNRVAAVEYAYLKDKLANWGPAEGATGYELYLFRDSKVVGSKKLTTETSYDFGTAMIKEGEYFYRVRGIGGEGMAAGPWLDSESFYRSSKEDTGTAEQKSNNSAIGAGVWQLDATGWWWQRRDHTWPASQWELINNKWYFFNEGGYMVTGWVNWNNLWYYLGPDGDMWVNCQTPDGYTVNADGVRIG